MIVITLLLCISAFAFARYNTRESRVRASVLSPDNEKNHPCEDEDDYGVFFLFR